MTPIIPLDQKTIREHVELLHMLAAPLADCGKLIVASYGEDPATGKEITPKVAHFTIGQTGPMTEAIIQLSREPHRNVYCPVAVMRKDLPRGDKGGETDVVGVLAIVADFDDGRAGEWAARLPREPDYVLETSEDRFQTFYLFDQPELDPAAAKNVALKLKTFTGCDNCSVDMSHVWRVPGTLNWPNSKKAKAGRSLDPQLARVISPWNGTRAATAELNALLPDLLIDPAPKPHPQPTSDGTDLAQLIDRLPQWLTARLAVAEDDRSKQIFWSVCKLINFDLDNATIERVIRHFPNGVGEKYIKRSDLGAEIARIRSKTAPGRKVRGRPAKHDPEISKTELKAELDRSLEDLGKTVDNFNRDYAVVNEAGKVWVFQWRPDPVLDREVLDRITHADFRRMYENRLLSVAVSDDKVVTKSLADWWLTHRQRRQYLGGVTFDPTRTAPPEYMNLWRGFSVEPKPGDWSLMRAHIEKVICNGDTVCSNYLLDWLARLFQQPQLAGEVAIVMRGAKGCGKGTLGRWIVAAFNRHGQQIFNPAQLVGRFNEHLRDLVVLFGDEAFYAGDKQHEGVLKGLITEPFLPIEGKFQNVVTVKNMLHIILASNADWVIPASTDERRYFMLDVPDTKCGNFTYFAEIEEQIKNGGLPAMLHDLLERDISQFQVRNVPRTEALAKQKALSLSSVERWWVDVLSRGFVWKSRHGARYFREWQEFYTTELLVRSYLQWSSENRPFDRKGREEVGRFLTKVYSPKRPRSSHPVYELDSVDTEEVKHGKPLDEASIVWSDHPHGYLIGTLDEARARLLETCDVPTEWRRELLDDDL